MRPHRSPRALPVVLVLSLLAALAGVALAPASDAAARRFVGAWLPYWKAQAAAESFTANADLFSDASPFWHALASESTVIDQATAADRTLVTSAIRSAGVRLVPTITDGSDPQYLAGALADPARRSTVVATITALVTSRGYDGIDLNFEGFAYSDGRATWPTTRPNWVAFVAELGQQLHERGKVLYATIPPTYDSNRTTSSGYWVYDYANIAPHVDRVRIMAYDYSVSQPGPIAPYDWVKRIAAYAITQIPGWKIVLGIPTYGRNWVTAVTGTCPPGTDTSRSSLTASAAWQLAASKGVSVQWDAVNRERTFSYSDTASDGTVSCRIDRIVYFSDASAVSERARLIDTYSLTGIALWSMGGEDPKQWDLLRVLAANPWDPRVAPQEVLEAFVRHGYQDVLGREPDPGGMQSWMSALRDGLSKAGFMNALIYSTEGTRRTTTAMYREILGRDPDPGGLVSWASAIAQQRVTVKGARIGFWASAERLAKSGSLEQWVADLYVVELGRPVDPSGSATWVSVAAAQGPTAAARGVIGSREWAQRQVRAQYQLMLKREADAGGLLSWTDVLMRTDVLVVQRGLGASTEYFMRS